jgi:glycerophosphoryl diester phosphodiesterase
MLDGALVKNGFWVSDFTLEELKTLHAVQPFADRPQRFNGKFEIPTFEQVLDLRDRMSKKLHRQIGVYPETKHPTYHEQLGLPLEGKLVRALRRHGLDHKRSPVFIQSFEQFNLKKLDKMTPNRLVQLVDAYDTAPDGSLQYIAPYDRPYDWTVSGRTGPEDTFGFFATDAGLDEIATYADGIGPWKRYIISSKAIKLDANGEHDRGLLVHTWTFRNENRYLASDYTNETDEYLQFFDLGIDGVFSDFAGTAVAARHLFELSR